MNGTIFRGSICPECDSAPCVCRVLESGEVRDRKIERVAGEVATEARRMADWDAWRQQLADQSVIGLDFQHRMTSEDVEFLKTCMVKL